MEPKHTKKMLLRHLQKVWVLGFVFFFGGEVFVSFFLSFFFFFFDVFLSFLFFKKSFICSFTAALGFCYCALAFSSRGKRGLISNCVGGFSLQSFLLAQSMGSRCLGFSSCG